MAKKRRSNRTAPAADPVNQYQHARDFLQSIAFYSPYDGASRSTRRGWIYWPNLDGKSELSRTSRTELMRRKRWLMANFGFPKRIIGGLSDLIGYLTPQWLTRDPNFNERAEELYMERANMPGVVEASGKCGMDAYQIHLNKSALGDGDSLPLWSSTASGGLSVVTVAAPRIMSPDEADPTLWFDGVKIDPRTHRHVAYGVQNGENVDTIDARNAGYYAHFDALDRTRPPTVLAHAINNLVDVSEILSDWKLAIKVAAQFGLYKQDPRGPQPGRGALAIASRLRDETVATADTSPDGSEVKMKIEDLYRAAGGVADMGSADLKVIQDSRPHPNQMNLLEFLMRDISWGVGVAPEILWNIEKLKGANNRLINSDLQRWIGMRLLAQRAWMKRFCGLWAGAEIRAGRLPYPANGESWFKVGFVPQASITADKGREGMLDIELVRNKMLSLARFFASTYGADWRKELDQIEIEQKEMGRRGLSMADVMAAAQQQRRDDPDERDENDDTPTEQAPD